MEFKTKPMDHQLEYLNKHGLNKINALFAEMGTGKTWMLINNAAMLWQGGLIDGLLVIAPNGVHRNWTRIEIPKHMPDSVNCVAHPWSSKQTKTEERKIEQFFYKRDKSALPIFTIHWDMLQHDRGTTYIDLFISQCKSLMIVADESDSFKEPTTLRAKYMLKIRDKSTYRRIASGLPINNSPFDLFTQFEFLERGILGTTSFRAFKAEYGVLMPSSSRLVQNIVKKNTPMDPGHRIGLSKAINDIYTAAVKSNNDDVIQIAELINMALDLGNYESLLENLDKLKLLINPSKNASAKYIFGQIVAAQNICSAYIRKVNSKMAPGRAPQILERDKNKRPKYKNIDKLIQTVAPYTYRKRKDECLDLPEKIYKSFIFELTEEQQRLYKMVSEQSRLEHEGEVTALNKLTVSRKLAQITSGFYYHPAEPEKPIIIKGENPKLNMLIEQVKKAINSGEKAIIWSMAVPGIQLIEDAVKKIGLRHVSYYGKTSADEREKAIDLLQSEEVDVFIANQMSGGIGLTLTKGTSVHYFYNDFSLKFRMQSEDRTHRQGLEKNAIYHDYAAEGSIDEYTMFCLQNKLDVAVAITDGIGNQADIVQLLKLSNIELSPEGIERLINEKPDFNKLFKGDF
jgi:SNF2 family DNA or RNA helicase